MARRIFLALATFSLVVSIFVGQQPVEAQSLSIKGAEFQGRRNRPHALRVSWERLSLPPGSRIEGYNILVVLSNDKVSGSIFQTPSPTLTAVSVGLLGIPAATRDALFKSGGPVNIRIALKARLIVNGTRTEAEVRRALTL